MLTRQIWFMFTRHLIYGNSIKVTSVILLDFIEHNRN
jgi:hypothetical protein